VGFGSNDQIVRTARFSSVSSPWTKGQLPHGDCL